MSVWARAEHVGSLLRPDALLAARSAHQAGECGAAELKRAEDDAVRAAVALQQQAGCPVVTDGEQRRTSFQSELTAAVDGVVGVDMNTWLRGDWYSDDAADLHVAASDELAVVEPLRKRRNLAAEEYTFLRSCLDSAGDGSGQGPVGKVTLPSPSLFASLWSPRRPGPYSTLDDFLADVVTILCDEVRELTRLGCEYIQLDAPHYPLLVDPAWREFYEHRGWDYRQWLSYGVELDNAVIEAGRPATFGFHLCRGNQRGRWLVSGGYDDIAASLFGQVRADRLLLEYDDERSGDFDPLRHVPDDTSVVLGLVSTKHAELEPADVLLRRIEQATAYVERDRLALGTQCGFATSLEGNMLGIDDERRKLAHLVATAEHAFSR